MIFNHLSSPVGPLSVSPSLSMFLFPSNLACDVLCEIGSAGVLLSIHQICVDIRNINTYSPSNEWIMPWTVTKMISPETTGVLVLLHRNHGQQNSWLHLIMYFPRAGLHKFLISIGQSICHTDEVFYQ